MASLVDFAKIDFEDDSENCILLDDVLIKIVKNIPVAEWPNLEIVSKQFRRCVHNVFRALNILDLKSVFLAEFGNNLKKGNEKVIHQFLSKLSRRSSLLRMISGLDCLFVNISPYHFGLLSEFTELQDISFESVSMDINDLSHFLKNFPQMRTLKLDATKIKPFHDTDFDFFENFCGLRKLSLQDTTLTCSGSFLSLINAENLTSLDFTDSIFNEINVGALLNRCANLETLKLTDPATCATCFSTGFEVNVLQCLPNVTKLRAFALDIDHNCSANACSCITYDSNALVKILSNCKSLREIRLRNFGEHQVEIFTDNFLYHLIGELLQLEVFEYPLAHCYSAEIVSSIISLENLTHLILTLHDNNILGTRMCSNLHKLNNLSRLELCGFVDSDYMLLIGLKKLTHFTCNGITETVVKKWIENGFLKKLTFLKIYYPDVVDGWVKSICENSPNLKELYCRLDEISDETLLIISQCCKYLQVIDLLNYCTRFSEKGLLNLLVNCCNLRCVKINVHAKFYHAILSNVLFHQFKHVLCLRCFGFEEK